MRCLICTTYEHHFPIEIPRHCEWTGPQSIFVAKCTRYYSLSIILGTVALSYGSVPMYKMVSRSDNFRVEKSAHVATRYASKPAGAASPSKLPFTHLQKILQHGYNPLPLLVAFGSLSMDLYQTLCHGNLFPNSEKFESFLEKLPLPFTQQQIRVTRTSLGLQPTASRLRRSPHISAKSNVSVLRSKDSTPEKPWICLFSFSSIQILLMIQP